ncbi:MAG: hypothetical protein VB142_02920 [Burkholderia sp.]
MLQKLDEWICRRLRCFLWRQWKRGWTRFQELIARGHPKTLLPRRCVRRTVNGAAVAILRSTSRCQIVTSDRLDFHRLAGSGIRSGQPCTDQYARWRGGRVEPRGPTLSRCDCAAPRKTLLRVPSKSGPFVAKARRNGL